MTLHRMQFVYVCHVLAHIHPDFHKLHFKTLKKKFRPAKRKKQEEKNKRRKFYWAVSRLDKNAIHKRMNLASYSLDPLCSRDNSQKSIFFDSLPPDFIILYMFGKFKKKLG